MNETLSRLLTPAASAFKFGVTLRNRAYDRGWFGIEDCGRPVISVGNLTAGGTGKTPFTKLLASSLTGAGARKVAIVSRGYRSESENSIEKVSTKNLSDAARVFGDEPAMLAHQLRDVPVYVGAKKLDVARFAVTDSSPDLILADDAFQHRRLKRSFDFVLLDATEPWWHFRPLPAGRLREPFSALTRAQAIVLTKVNLAESNRVDRIRDAARMHVDSSRMPLFIEIEYRINKFSTLSAFHKGEVASVSSSDLKSERLFLISAIARPAAFIQLVKQETGALVVGSLELRDHAHLGAGEAARAVKEAAALSATRLVMTEKDAVKFKSSDFLSAEEPLVSHLEAIPQQNWSEVHERFVSLGI